MFNKLGELLTNAWTWVKGLWPTPAPDTRPDLEDTTVYDHAIAYLQSFDGDKAEVFQILRKGGKPTDIADSIADLRSVPTLPAEYDFWVDVYDGPKGKGFVFNYETTRDKVVIQKRMNFGPEEWREQDWTEVPVVKA